MDKFKSIKERKRTQSWLGSNRRQSHVLGTSYYSGISPLIVSETLQGLPFPVVQIQLDTGLSTELLNSLVLGSFSSSQVYQFPVPPKFNVSHSTYVNLYWNLPYLKHTVVAEPQSTEPVDHLLNRGWPGNFILHLQLSDITGTVLLGIKIGKKLQFYKYSY